MNKNNLNKQDLANVLVDVRKSYRLLYEYQRRVLDLVKYTGNYFGYSNAPSIWYWFSEEMRHSKSFPLDKWAWDGLGMYMLEFHFSTKEKEDQQVIFSSIIQADTGYFDAIQNDKKLNRTDVDKFNPATDSKTRLILLASSKGWKGDILWREKKNNEHNFSKNKTRWQAKDDENNQLAIAYNLEEFLNQTETDNILKEFGEECEKFGIQLLEKIESK